MQKLAVSGPAAFLFVSILITTPSDLRSCLPPGIDATDIVSAQLLKSGHTIKKITVAQKLTQIKARCKKGKLVDASGKEIYFYRLAGCWGNPPEDYREILKHQAGELEKLKKQYTVIEMTCDPDGASIH